MAWLSKDEASKGTIEESRSYRVSTTIIRGPGTVNTFRTTITTYQFSIVALEAAASMEIAETLNGEKSDALEKAGRYLSGVSLSDNATVVDAMARRQNDAGAWRVDCTIEDRKTESVSDKDAEKGAAT